MKTGLEEKTMLELDTLEDMAFRARAVFYNNPDVPGWYVWHCATAGLIGLVHAEKARRKLLLASR